MDLADSKSSVCHSLCRSIAPPHLLTLRTGAFLSFLEYVLPCALHQLTPLTIVAHTLHDLPLPGCIAVHVHLSLSSLSHSIPQMRIRVQCCTATPLHLVIPHEHPPQTRVSWYALPLRAVALLFTGGTQRAPWHSTEHAASTSSPHHPRRIVARRAAGKRQEISLSKVDHLF